MLPHPARVPQVENVQQDGSHECCGGNDNEEGEHQHVVEHLQPHTGHDHSDNDRMAWSTKVCTCNFKDILPITAAASAILEEFSSMGKLFNYICRGTEHGVADLPFGK